MPTERTTSPKPRDVLRLKLYAKLSRGVASMKIVNQLGRPVAGYVEFVFSRPGQGVDAEAVEIGSDGTVPVPVKDGVPPRLGVVKPVDGHWNLLIEWPSPGQTGVCSPMAMPNDMTWWKTIVGRGAPDPTAGEGIKIAVIDLGFQPHGSMAHVRVLDVEGDEPDLGFIPFESHGERVCKILGERGPSIDGEGIAPGADLYLVDISDEEIVDDFDGEKLGAAIEVVAEKHGVDLINISAGAYIDGDDSDYSNILKKSVEFARERGSLVFAATGNSGTRQPAIPARLDQVVGVGAIGQCDIAPPGSFMRYYQDHAADMGSNRGTLGSGEGVFHYVESCYGRGLDVVGPGIGINLRHDGTRVVEYVGTSYACPIVVGVLACSLSRNLVYRDARGRVRARLAEEVLREMCQNLGMDSLRQGVGLPILRAL